MKIPHDFHEKSDGIDPSFGQAHSRYRSEGLVNHQHQRSNIMKSRMRQTASCVAKSMIKRLPVVVVLVLYLQIES